MNILREQLLKDVKSLFKGEKDKKAAERLESYIKLTCKIKAGRKPKMRLDPIILVDRIGVEDEDLRWND